MATSGTTMRPASSASPDDCCSGMGSSCILSSFSLPSSSSVDLMNGNIGKLPKRLLLLLLLLLLGDTDAEADDELG